MSTVGIRALKQNASAVVAQAAAGERITITDRGRPVVEMMAVLSSPFKLLLISGRARPPRRNLRDLPEPEPGPSLSSELDAMREAERY
jgi:prevent-host-death family protein